MVDGGGDAPKPDRMAIGVDGGFHPGGPPTRVETEAAVVALPDGLGGRRAVLPLPEPALPPSLADTLAAVTAAESAAVADAAATWEEERRVSKYAAGLPQLETGMGAHGRAIPADPSSWKCDETGATDNLWLNLSTGFIGSGRPNWDGSGGNGAAMRHFEATGKKFPLVVKLGTITPHAADVYSYAPDEDDMVVDPELTAHLAHWGIHRGGLVKTEKSMAELQVDLNLAHEFDRVTEAGASLDPVSGPGAVGLTNLGNSCYLASVVQALWGVPALRARYSGAAAASLLASAPADVAGDLLANVAKLGVALASGETDAEGEVVVVGEESEAAAPSDKPKPTSVRPTALKTIVGRGHPEFSTARQQDAVEFLQHFLDLLTRAERAGADRVAAADAAAGAALAATPPTPTSDALRFVMEERVACGATGAARYTSAESTVLSLDIPLDAATNAADVAAAAVRDAKRARVEAAGAAAYIGVDGGVEKADGGGSGAATTTTTTAAPHRVLPRVPLAACISKWGADETVDGYKSAAAGGAAVTATRRARFASFPPFLALQLKRFYVAPDWTPRKLDVLVDVPDDLDLEPLRGGGPQPGEQLQPEDGGAGGTDASADSGPSPDPDIVAAVVAMGFSENGAKRAALATANAGAEGAMEWVLAHMGDADFNDPPPTSGGGGTTTTLPAADPTSVAMLASMGFDDRAATAALTATGGDVERAADWLFSRADGDLTAAVDAALAPGGGGGCTASTTTARPAADGPGRYTLAAVVSHVGANAGCGHYVAHARRSGRWLLLNDDKVAASAAVPRELGYLYLYRRVDVEGGDGGAE